MAMERWEPVEDVLQLRRRVDELFQDLLGRSPGLSGAETQEGIWRPACDVWEQGDRYVLRVDLPGVLASDVTIEIEGGALRVSGERRTEVDVPRDAVLRAERPSGRFALSMALPPSVDPDGTEARQKDGVLEITLRRKGDGTKGRVRVDVK